MTNICVVGAGKHGRANIYPALAEAGFGVVAVCTRSIEGSQQAISQCGLTANPYDNVADMLANESCPNVAVVAQAHDAVSIVEQCIMANKNVFVEKPLGMSVAEAEHIASLATVHNVVVMVGFMKRHAPSYIQTKQLIDNGSMGAVCAFDAVMAVDATSWCTSQSDFVYYVVVHYLDLIRYLFGEVASISAHKSEVSGGQFAMSITVSMSSGVVGSILFVNGTAWSREHEQITVTLEGGYIVADNLTQLTVHNSSTECEALPWSQLGECDKVYSTNTGPASGTTRDLYMRGFVQEMHHFAHCCNGGIQPTSSAQDNINTTKLCQQLVDMLV